MGLVISNNCYKKIALGETMPMSALSSSSLRALRAAHAQHPQQVESVLADVANGASAASALQALQQCGADGLDVSAVQQAAALSTTSDLFGAVNTHADVVGAGPQQHALDAGGRSPLLQWNVQHGQASLAELQHLAQRQPLSASTQASMASAQHNVGAVGAMASSTSAKDKVPGLGALEALKAGDAHVDDVATALKAGLLAAHPAARKKAASTLQVAESYARKAQQDAVNYAGTGFRALPFPSLKIALSAAETTSLVRKLVQGKDGNVVDIVRMAQREGLLTPTPADAFNDAKLDTVADGKSGRLAGSDGRESPRDADSFHDEWVNTVEPGLQNIRSAIISTARARGGSCPYAHGNHAKGVAFGGAEMKVNKNAPQWAQDLFGDQLSGGMIRVSGSQTNPDQPDTEAHMPGIRIAFPLTGQLDGSATQLIDLTANTGDTTHAQTAAEHTRFTQNISVPKGRLSGSTPLRALRHALGGLLEGKSPLRRIRQMRNAVEVTGMANAQRFDEHVFHARHAFFVGGRYVQVTFKVVEPKPFVDGRQRDTPNGRLDAVSETVANKGMKLEMFITEMPDGNPDLVEQEGWKGLPSFALGTIELPPQTTDPTSEASDWFAKVGHVPAGADKVFHAVGLGRHRVPIYEESARLRQQPPGSLG
mgnify:CR=1 FL=1